MSYFFFFFTNYLLLLVILPLYLNFGFPVLTFYRNSEFLMFLTVGISSPDCHEMNLVNCACFLLWPNGLMNIDHDTYLLFHSLQPKAH